MPWKMNCLLCEPGTKWHPAFPHCGSTNLVEIQEHLRDEHLDLSVYEERDKDEGFRNALRHQTNRLIAPNHYEYVLPDGRTWLRAWK